MMFWLDYNTRLVLAGTSMLGAASGIVGVFLLLRRRALIGDAVAHATLPGIAFAFLLGTAWGWEEKSLGWLLSGAAVSGLLASLTIVRLRNWTTLKEDAILAIVLSLYFAVGVALLRFIQQVPDGYAAGLEGFIYGKAASMVASDSILIAVTSAVMAILIFLFHRPLQVLCFDESFAGSQGWPTVLIDLALVGCATVVVIVGLQAVGLILIIAMLIVPAATARFWTHRLLPMIWIAASIGATGSIVGALISATFTDVPSGAAIVLATIGFFLVSGTLGPMGVWWRWSRLMKQRSQADVDHLLRSSFELLELQGKPPEDPNQTRSKEFNLNDLKMIRSWSPRRLRMSSKRLLSEGLIVQISENRWSLTSSGIRAALRTVRQHRLLELYFAQIANLSPEALDRGADYFEHALDEDMLAKLESKLDGTAHTGAIPGSLHPIGNEGATG